MRCVHLAVSCLIAALAAPAALAVKYMDQVSGGGPSGGVYPVASGSSCMDDFEIFGITGEAFGQIQSIQAVVMGTMPPAFRVNIYHNTGDPQFNNLRMLTQGDFFTRVFTAEEVLAQPFPIAGEAGNFPGAVLLTFNMNNLPIPFGSYYLAVVAEGSAAPFFVVGSNNVEEGTPLNLVQVQNQGPAGTANVIADNAAYRVNGPDAPPGNDNCSSALTVTLGTTSFNSSDATTDGVSSCGGGGGADVWFSFISPQSGLLHASTCPSTFDTILTIFDSCGGSELACNDDAPPNTCSDLFVPVVAGATYRIRVAGFAGDMGTGILTLAFDPPPLPCLSPPAGSTPEGESCGEDFNGGCNAPGSPVQLISSNAVVFGSAFADGGSRDTDWYEFSLDQESIVEVSLEAEFTGRVFIASTTCPAEVLVTTTCPRCGPPGVLTPTLGPGPVRIIVAHNAFDGTPCDLFGRTHYILRVRAGAPGACCTDAGCMIALPGACAELGGTFQGDGTTCGDAVYSAAPSPDPFQDIRPGASASVAGDCDDCGEVVPIGFPFNFFGELRNQVGISSNGYLNFGGGPLNVFNNTAIPTADGLNNLVCPAWDDWNPGAAGEIHYRTSGLPPNRRFSVQWTQVTQFNVIPPDSSTFQVILYEGSGNIEFRYAPMVVQPAGDITVGVEDAAGSAAISLDAPSVIGAGNTAQLLTGTFTGPCSAPPCLADFNGDGLVFPDDLSEFITCFFLQVQFPGFCPLGDFNGDGLVFPDDLSEFITTFFLAVQFGC